MADDLKVGVVGAAGRMGRMVVGVVGDTPGCTIAGATEAAGSAHIGADAGALAGIGALGVVLADDPAPMFAAVDVVIDFTAPAATVAHAALAAQARCALVAGTTGLAADDFGALERAGRHTPIVWASNMSAGVNLLFALTEQVARTLGPEVDIEIVEMHHRHKVDAPSGTALSLGEAAARGRGVALADVADRGRDGMTGARATGHIGFAALRGGDVVGEHTVVFAAEGERVELTHKAGSRALFARGAVRAARWARSQPPGLYSMADVLGLGG